MIGVVEVANTPPFPLDESFHKMASFKAISKSHYVNMNVIQ